MPSDNSNVLRLIRVLWRTNRALTLGFGAMWVCGVFGAACGIWLDSRDYWSDRPFATNMFSAAVGALFGIPVAVLAIQQFSALSANAIAQARHEADLAVSLALAHTRTETLLRLLSARIATVDEILHNEPHPGFIVKLDRQAIDDVDAATAQLVTVLNRREDSSQADAKATLRQILLQLREERNLYEDQLASPKADLSHRSALATMELLAQAISGALRSLN